MHYIACFYGFWRISVSYVKRNRCVMRFASRAAFPVTRFSVRMPHVLSGQACMGWRNPCNNSRYCDKVSQVSLLGAHRARLWRTRMKKRDGSPRRPYYRRETLRFQCTACGACCMGDEHHHVFLTRDEARKICRWLGLTWAWFRRRYLSRLDDGTRVLSARDDGRCVFLDARGRCRVYAVRPVQCATYPFWPEVVATAPAWRGEARRCEGIGRGGAVPVRVIEAALRS
ncbi:MAG TPA: YkgJ family cysteine cluster protein [Chromatiales bacterium]|nr:YkgJ family cysteine cluster protein [Chromatiales bacterium]